MENDVLKMRLLLGEGKSIICGGNGFEWRVWRYKCKFLEVF